MKSSIVNIILKIIKCLAIYYLSAKMICFAIPKLLFMQFRILHWQSYSPLVETSKFLHMWSFFGRSYNYNIFIGLVEFLIGVLIVFKRTNLIALFLAFGLCVNILILNIEFDVHFAILHISLDLVLIIFLLLGYRKNLYKFFIQFGGRLDTSTIVSKNKLAMFLPLSFVTVLSISYFIYALNLKSRYSVDEHIVGAHEIKNIKVNDSIINMGKGQLAREPMLFMEHNKQFLLSIEDSLYTGRYILKKDSIRIYLDTHTKFGMKSLTGLLGENHIIGKMENDSTVEIVFEKIPGEKNYLNGLYR